MNNKILPRLEHRSTVWGMGAATTLEQQTFLDEHTQNDVELAAVHAYKKDTDEQGGLMTQAQAAMVLGVGTTRVNQLVDAGTLDSFEHFKKRLIGCDQLILYAKHQKLSGNTGAAILRAFKSVWMSTSKS